MSTLTKGPKLGADKTVLEVVSVSASSQRIVLNSDPMAEKVLEDAGFVGIKFVAKRVIGRPPGGDTFFLLQYDATFTGKQKPFQLLRIDKVACLEIDVGRTFYIPDAMGGRIEVLAQGDLIKDWELMCEIASKESIDTYIKMLARGGIIKRNTQIPFSSRQDSLEVVEEYDQQNNQSELKKLLTPRLKALSLALAELKGVTVDEWQWFATLRGSAKLSSDIPSLTQTIKDLDEVKGRMSQAKVLLKDKAPKAPV